jgi:hypothetical protein
MKLTVSCIAILLVLAFMLTLSVIAYIEAWNTVKSSMGLMDAMYRALAGCILILLTILLVMLSVSVAVILYCMLSRC